MPKPYAEWNQVITFPFGTVVYDIDVSPDGSAIAASFGEISGKQEVRVLGTAEALSGDLTPIARFDFGNSVPNGFVFSPDGRYLFGSSYYTGASNIFRYDLEEKTLDAVTNAETGFFRPVPLGGDALERDLNAAHEALAAGVVGKTPDACDVLREESRSSDDALSADEPRITLDGALVQWDLEIAPLDGHPGDERLSGSGRPDRQRSRRELERSKRVRPRASVGG
jgi:hypothetical protein